MDRYDIQKFRDLPIEGVAERLGLSPTRHKALCPFHDDHHASLTFNPRRNTYRCFACGAHGDTISLAMQTLSLRFPDACRWLAEGSAVRVEGLGNSSSPSTLPPHPFNASRYERFFQRPSLSVEARRFLFDERRLDPRVVHWCRLTTWRDRQGTPWLQIPYFDREGKLIGIQNRNLSYSLAQPSSPTLHLSAPRFRFPRGTYTDIYNLPVLARLRTGETLCIAEGCSDCWAMLSAGMKAVAIPSATLLKASSVGRLRALVEGLGTTFRMYPDRDLPGERLFLSLRELLPTLERHELPEGCKDFSEYYLQSLTPKPP